MEMETAELLREFLRSGEQVLDADVEDILIEAVVVSNADWNDYRELLHKDIPSALADVLSGAGLRDCRIYFLKDDVSLPDYIAECRDVDGRNVALELGVNYDDEVGEVELLWLRAYKDAHWTPNILVYYTDVTPKN